MKKHPLQVLALAAVCGLMLTACQYHWGSARPEGLYGLDVGAVTNLTQEGALTAAFRKSVQEQISTDPGLNGNLITHQLNVELENLYQKNIARAELRDRNSRNDDSTAYQTVLYRLELRANGPDGYEALAWAEPSQLRDRACPVLGLQVRGEISQHQPGSACWKL